MPKTMDDLIGAANCIVNELLGSEATAEDIRAALRQVCQDWPEGDQQGALRLALEFADLIGHTTFEVSMTDDEERTRAQQEHYLFVFDQLNAHLGRADYRESDEERQESYFRRHVLYPFRW
jgi:hypothetical protein